MTDNRRTNDAIRAAAGRRPINTAPAPEPGPDAAQLAEDRRTARAEYLEHVRGMTPEAARIAAEEAIPAPLTGGGDFGGGYRGTAPATGRALTGSQLIREAAHRSRTGDAGSVDVIALERELKANPSARRSA